VIDPVSVLEKNAIGARITVLSGQATCHSTWLASHAAVIPTQSTRQQGGGGEDEGGCLYRRQAIAGAHATDNKRGDVGLGSTCEAGDR
jgi:hypothetical protein